MHWAGDRASEFLSLSYQLIITDNQFLPGEAGAAAQDGYDNAREGVADMREQIEEAGHDAEGLLIY